jgi:hypothetical protein
VVAATRSTSERSSVLGALPASAVEDAHGPAQVPALRDGVGRDAGVDRAPHQGHAGPGVDPAGQQGGQVGDQPAEGVDQVDGQLRARGVPAGAGEGDVHPVAGRGDGAGAQADAAGRERRVAVQGEGAGGPVQHAGGDHLGRAAGHVSSAGWKTQRTVPGRSPSSARASATPEQDGGVHVVPAGVAGVLAGGGVGTSLRSASGSASMSARSTTTGSPEPDLDDQPGAAGSRWGSQAGVAQPLLEEGRRLELGVGELGVGVQVPADGDQLRCAGDPLVDRRPQLLGTVIGGPSCARHAAAPGARAGPGTGPRRVAGPTGGQAVPQLGEQAVDDGGQVAVVARGDRALPLVGGADGQTRCTSASSASQPSRRAVGSSSSTRSAIAWRTGRTVPLSSTTMSASRP